MIDLTFNKTTGAAALVLSGSIIKPGGDIPVRVTFDQAPGDATTLTLALGSNLTPPRVLAYTDTFTKESDTVWTATLDGNDTRLVAHMLEKLSDSVNIEVSAVIEGKLLDSPNVPIQVQQKIVRGPESSQGGPTYYTEAEADAAFAPKTVATKYRFKTDGSFQLWNADQSKWHTLTVSGAAGAEVLGISAGE